MNIMIVLIAEVVVIISLLVKVAQLEMKLAEQEGRILAIKAAIDYCIEEIRSIEAEDGKDS